MTNEEFQTLVLQKLSNLETDVGDLKSDVSSLKEGQARMEKKLDAVYEQTAFLTEFQTEVKAEIKNIKADNKSIHEVLGEHEISIRTLRRQIV